jgi:hypothetical protein
MAYSVEIVTDFYCIVSLYSMAPSANQLRRSGPWCISKFAAVAQSTWPNLLQWPVAHHQICRRTKFPVNCFRSRIRGPVGYFYEITLDNTQLSLQHESGAEVNHETYSKSQSISHLFAHKSSYAAYFALPYTPLPRHPAVL